MAGGFDRQIRAIVLSLVVSQKLGTLASSENSADLVALEELIESGKVKPVIDRTYPLNDVPAAIRYLIAGQARGKLAIAIRATAACTRTLDEAHPHLAPLLATCDLQGREKPLHVLDSVERGRRRGVDLDAIVRKVIDDNRYMTIATSSPEAPARSGSTTAIPMSRST